MRERLVQRLVDGRASEELVACVARGVAWHNAGKAKRSTLATVCSKQRSTAPRRDAGTRMQCSL